MTDCTSSDGCTHYMQPRCVNCKRELYAPAVWEISHGRTGCHMCGWVPATYGTLADYRAALKGGRKSYDRF